MNWWIGQDNAEKKRKRASGAESSASEHLQNDISPLQFEDVWSMRPGSRNNEGELQRPGLRSRASTSAVAASQQNAEDYANHRHIGVHDTEAERDAATEERDERLVAGGLTRRPA